MDSVSSEHHEHSIHLVWCLLTLLDLGCHTWWRLVEGIVHLCISTFSFQESPMHFSLTLKTSCVLGSIVCFLCICSTFIGWEANGWNHRHLHIILLLCICLPSDYYLFALTGDETFHDFFYFCISRIKGNLANCCLVDFVYSQLHWVYRTEETFS